jgi:KUP system potassium uptake protein
MSAPPTEEPRTRAEPQGARLATLSLAALGVVYGDIGTSPLYAFRECLNEHSGAPPSAPNVLGILSLIFWALVIIISVKYGSPLARPSSLHKR